MCTCVYARKKNTIKGATIPSNSLRIDFKKVCDRNLSSRQDNANHKMTLIEAASTLINHDYPQYQLNTIKAA